MWTFGRRIAIGFAVAFVLLLLVGTAAYRGIDSLTNTSYLVTHTHQVLERIARMVALVQEAEAGERGFIITGDTGYVERANPAMDATASVLKELRELTLDNARQQRRLDTLEPVLQARLAELRRIIDVRQQQGLEAAIRLVQTGQGKKSSDTVHALADQMERDENELLKLRADEVEAAAANARSKIVYGTTICLLFVVATGFFITRALTNRIATTVRHMQSSSTQLQTAANQQATGAKESSSSMTEITTTISELLATSRQIAESAQRVAGIAEQTAGAARSGEGTVRSADESIASIRQQVDLVVGHTLELGRKSQQIGVVLDIVAELAEQTNILAINATIEAAGAGEAGKRFSVVADEIRKLADRVGGSTKEIRALIDDVRGAVNTTVMATETGSKAVDAGSKEFGDVAAAFKQIAGMVVTTTQAAREIELSTKQQASAVEQVNLAIASTAQATRETEVSLEQTLQTAAQLAGLSKDLMRLVQPQRAA